MKTYFCVIVNNNREQPHRFLVLLNYPWPLISGEHYSECYHWDSHSAEDKLNWKANDKLLAKGH